MAFTGCLAQTGQQNVGGF